MLFKWPQGARMADPMTAEETRGIPESTDVEDATRGSMGGACAAVAPGPAWLKNGQLLGGRYRIERELGEGGMGVVYLVADQQVPGERFAIKVLKEELHPAALSLLREEVRKTRGLSHPNIVDVHSVNVDGQRLYVLMECLEGKSLDTLLNEDFGRGMPWSRAWPIVEDVGAALRNAHERNVIHSDLKPANVFVTTSGRTKLLDFGIARISRGPLLGARSRPQALTPGYASCEMLEGKEADRRDDIYSFACVIYEMLSGERPFREPTALDARRADARVRPLEGLSRAQNSALAQALAFGREGRTSSVEQLLEGLSSRQNPGGRSIGIVGIAASATVVVLGLTYLVLNRPWVSKQAVTIQSPTSASLSAFNPPAHSIAVLPFVNMSGDPGQEYFSDGVTEELLNSLVRIKGLRVVARTSSFSFKGKNTDLGTIAHKLNVGTVLEGSVRRAGNTVRITAQLDDAVTGFNLWSQTYDRDLGDMLDLQTQIATEVAASLQVTLLGDVAARIQAGGTRNPAAFDAYLRGCKAFYNRHHGVSDIQEAIEAYTRAIQLDPRYALAYAGRASALNDHAQNFATGQAARIDFDESLSDANTAIALAPDVGEGYGALASTLSSGFFEFARASENYEREIALAPGNAFALSAYARFAVFMGRGEAAVAAARKATELDPLNAHVRTHLVIVLLNAHRFAQAVAAADDLSAFDPKNPYAAAMRGLAYYAVGEFQNARSSCEAAPENSMKQTCLAVTYNKLGRQSDAEALLSKYKSSAGDDGAYDYAEIYAQWGDIVSALQWLETAMRLRDSGMAEMKTDILLDPLRAEPRYQMVERALKFPD
jgi:eukaryotic-like serine/threonine-protein kinase